MILESTRLLDVHYKPNDDTAMSQSELSNWLFHELWLY
jgi:hypothetical protein